MDLGSVSTSQSLTQDMGNVLHFDEMAEEINLSKVI